MGTTLNHDDSLNDRTEGSDLEKAFNVTKRLWKDLFGADYVVDGGMYRGEPPPQYFRKAFGLSKLDLKPGTDPSYYDLSSLRAPLMDLSQRICGGSGGGGEGGGGGTEAIPLAPAREWEAAPVVGMPVAPAQPDTISLQCPAGAGPGTTLQAQHNGMTIQVQVPAGVSPGQNFSVMVPAAQQEAATVPVVQGTWLDPSGIAPDGQPAFIQAAVRAFYSQPAWTDACSSTLVLCANWLRSLFLRRQKPEAQIRTL